MVAAFAPADAVAKARLADLAVERVSASSSAVSFVVVNRGGARAAAATVRVKLLGARGAVPVGQVRQSALRAGARARHELRVTGVTAGSWRAEVCAAPRTDRSRRNDCARAARPFTIAAAPAFMPLPAAPLAAAGLAPGAADAAGTEPSTAAGEAIAPTPAATPAVTATTTPAATATATPTPSGTAAPTPTPTATPSATATPTPSPTSTPTPSPSPTATPTTTEPPVPPADPRDAATSFRQNAAHDGRAFGTTPEPPLTTAWTRDLGAVPSYPLIAEGRVVAITEGGMLQVLDLRNGALLWTRAIGVFNGTATYDDGRVYVTDADGFTMAIDAQTGETLWSTWLWEEAKPVAYGGKLYSGSEGAVLRERRRDRPARVRGHQGPERRGAAVGGREPHLLRDRLRRCDRVQPLHADARLAGPGRLLHDDRQQPPVLALRRPVLQPELDQERRDRGHCPRRGDRHDPARLRVQHLARLRR